MRLLLIAASCALALAACGGSDKKTGNAAASTRFTYGASTSASPAQAAALEGSVAGSTAFAAAPSADGGLALSDMSLLTEALLGASGFGIGAAGPAPAQAALTAAGSTRRALTATGFDNPACVQTSATGVTLSHCTLTVDEVSGTSTFHLVVTASGSVGYAAAARTLSWDLRVGETVTVSGTTSGSAAGSVHMAGSLTVTETTITGHMTTEFAMTAAANGQSMAVGVDESVDIDVTYADAAACATRVTGGTLEAKRVWTARPQGATADDLPDAAARVTWTGCGTATIEYGTR